MHQCCCFFRRNWIVGCSGLARAIALCNVGCWYWWNIRAKGVRWWSLPRQGRLIANIKHLYVVRTIGLYIGRLWKITSSHANHHQRFVLASQSSYPPAENSNNITFCLYTRLGSRFRSWRKLLTVHYIIIIDSFTRKIISPFSCLCTQFPRRSPIILSTKIV